MPGSTFAKSIDTDNKRLISAQRYAFILDILKDRGIASIQELSDRVGVSFSTVRRDLDHLARKGLVVRNRGGASLPGAHPAADRDSGPEVPSDEETERAARALALQAAERIEDGQSVIFSSGSIIEAIAREIVAQGKSITAVTNSMTSGVILARSPKVRLIVLGGTVRPGSFVAVGEPGQSFLSRLHVHTALITAQSVSSGRITAQSVEVADMKRTMIDAARRSIIIATPWSVGGPAFCDVAPLEIVDEVIVASTLPAEEQAKLLSMDVTTTFVDVGSAS